MAHTRPLGRAGGQPESEPRSTAPTPEPVNYPDTGGCLSLAGRSESLPVSLQGQVSGPHILFSRLDVMPSMSCGGSLPLGSEMLGAHPYWPSLNLLPFVLQLPAAPPACRWVPQQERALWRAEHVTLRVRLSP